MRRLGLLAALGAALVVTSAPDVAHACGGCFSPPTENTVVTAHRMAMSVSQAQTVLWDQIEYTGDPADFSWVLPVREGATVAIASDAFFDVLEAATGIVVGQPQVNCGGGGSGWYEGGGSGEPVGEADDGGGFGCGGDETLSGASFETNTTFNSPIQGSGSGGGDPPRPAPPKVQVVSQGTIGPYETVTLSTDDPSALQTWLTGHGYVIPDDIQPTIETYVEEGFDFLALRLAPGQGVAAMKPVRITMPGSSFTLPLRMVAAGTGANTALSLFMIGEGRYQTANFPAGQVASGDIVWDFLDDSSNYAELRLEAMAAEEGRSWITSYARRGALLEPIEDNLVPNMPPNVTYDVDGQSYQTIAQAVVKQALANAETFDENCLLALEIHADSVSEVVDNCDENGMCAPLATGQISADEFRCGQLDDLAVAFTGLHPRDVWLSRLEANLPREALDQDLILEAASGQLTVHNRVVAPKSDNHPCDQQASIAPLSRSPSRLPGGPALPTLIVVGAWLAHRRRLPAGPRDEQRS